MECIACQEKIEDSDEIIMLDDGNIIHNCDYCKIAYIDQVLLLSDDKLKTLYVDNVLAFARHVARELWEDD